MTDTTDWYALAERLEATAVRMIELLELPTTERKETYAISLLARSISNFGAVIGLLRNGFVIEARTVMRCCWENTFYLARIARDGEAFVERMVKDDLTTRRAMGERLFQQNLVERGTAAEEELRRFLKTLEADKGRSLTPKGIADGGPIANGYIIYMTVSDDAAHPTVRSLSRHLREGPESGIITGLNISLPVDEEEVIETLDFACGALIGGCYAFSETMGGSRAAREVKERLAEMERLKGLGVADEEAL